MSTNGNLLTLQKLRTLAANGLNELIISAHGMSKGVYEYMMRNASFEHFTELINNIATVKKEYPLLKVRINYTMCSDNIKDLKLFPKVFSDFKPDVIQLRPVQDIGSKAYSNYSVQPIVDNYKACVDTVIEFCKANKIVCLYPEAANLSVIQQENNHKQHLNSAVDMLPYFHLSPWKEWKTEFNPYEENFEQYAKRTHRVRNIIKMILGIHTDEEEGVTKALNYNIK